MMDLQKTVISEGKIDNIKTLGDHLSKKRLDLKLLQKGLLKGSALLRPLSMTGKIIARHRVTIIHQGS